MDTKYSRLVVAVFALTCCILIEFPQQANADIVLTLESSGASKNSSSLVAKIKEASQRESERVSEKVHVVKEKQIRGAWRTRKDLEEFRTATAHPADETFSMEGATVRAPIKHQKASNETGESMSSSHRKKRTFWPFTSLFSDYDYDYPMYPRPPPPYGMFGGPSFAPPFGGGFGYQRPFGPPPSLFGREFGLGL